MITVQYQQPGGSCRVGGAGVLRGSWTVAQVGKIEKEKASSVRTGMASPVLQPHTPLWSLASLAVFAAWVNDSVAKNHS